MNDQIKQVEAKWMDTLFQECSVRFAPIHLPSHDQWHHLRVWHFARAIILSAQSRQIVISKNDIEETMIAVFFHDQGMIQTTAKEHGMVSRKMCSGFFTENKHLDYAPSENLLQAIEDHDQKNYKDTTPLLKFNLQKFVNMADDLDAFGITGVYRYLEIYLLRHITITSLPEMILKNLALRYRYLSQSLVSQVAFLNEQQPRFETVICFFQDLQQQLFLMGTKPLDTEKQGPLGVVNCIRDEIIGRNILPNEVHFSKNADDLGDYAFSFFKKLKAEYEGDAD